MGTGFRSAQPGGGAGVLCDPLSGCGPQGVCHGHDGRICGAVQFPAGAGQSGIPPCGGEYGEDDGGQRADPGGMLADAGGAPAERDPWGKVVQERSADPYGHSGGVRSAALAVYLCKAGIFERSAAPVRDSGDGLDEHGLCVCGPGIQLCLEKSGVQRDLVDRRAGGNPGGDPRGGPDRRGRGVGDILADHGPKPVFRIFHDHGAVADQCL